jgi:hypothetical protein
LISSPKENLDRNRGAEINTTALPFKKLVLDLIGDARTTVTSVKMKVSYKIKPRFYPPRQFFLYSLPSKIISNQENQRLNNL